MQTDPKRELGQYDDNLADGFQGIDNRYYYYIDPNEEEIIEPISLEIVGEYEYAYCNDDDELMMDKYLIAQHNVSTVDYELLLMAHDWVDLDQLSDVQTFQEKVADANAKRQKGVEVNDTFSRRLIDSSIKQIRLERKMAPLPPTLDELDGRVRERFSGRHDPINPFRYDKDNFALWLKDSTRPFAREQIDVGVKELKAKHQHLAECPIQSFPPVNFSPEYTMFMDLRTIEAQAQNKIRALDLKASVAYDIHNVLQPGKKPKAAKKVEKTTTRLQHRKS
ncbi:hypothetical protein GNI_118730 [Gregarina niphandrodes]|uniref:Uncharacterized protein n=1 Tax=Gregarina niphandrodes TaxID=110365 RepID=A0A023B345_GRENI|nr:hypothetical protein GNI_118730 [Gregarina niphandrodes]EZG55072.1 hypothetical protein GNI_118730 [Gregarina niphandrodes]|eukprot:XP_011131798.1 hypothetical protein GNI_118730 [Gregarina niphandrodes]